MGSNGDNSIDRRRFVEMLGLGTAVGLAGCAGDGDETTATGGDPTTDSSGGGGEQDTPDGSGGGGGGEPTELVYRGHETFQTLNPYMTIKTTLHMTSTHLYSTLVKADADLGLHGDLATDWESNDDITAWTFTLRENATFNHNDEQVTAEDVKATFDKITDEELGAPAAGEFGPLESVTAVDETTVEFQLSRPSPGFPAYLVKGYASIAPKEVMENEFESLDTQVYGSGPFVLEEFAPNDYVEMSAADNYHLTDEDGNQLPHIDRLTHDTIVEDSTAVNQLQNDTVQLIPDVTIPQFSRVNNMQGVEALEIPTGTFGGVVMNCQFEPFDDWRVRKAFKLACDYQTIVDNIVSGHGTLGQDSIIGPAYDQWYEDLGRQQDVERAQELLAEAGYPDGIALDEEFDITFWSSNEQSFRVPMGLEIQQQLEENLNVTVPFNEITHETYINEYWGEAALSTVVYEMRITVNDLLRTIIWSEGGWSHENGWNNDRADELINMASSTTDTEERRQHYADLQELMMERGPHMVVMYENRLGAIRDTVQNYEHSPLSRRLWLDEVDVAGN